MWVYVPASLNEVNIVISLEDTRAHGCGDVGSDHNLVITKAKLEFHSTSKKQVGNARYEESKLRN